MTEMTQGVLLYTQEELDEKVAEGTRRLYAEIALYNTKTSEAIVNVLKSEINEGNIEKDYANALYDLFCDNAGLVRQDIKTTYSVTVSYRGNELATFAGIEASSEEEAIDVVQDDLVFDDIEVSMTLEHDGNTEYGSMTLSNWEFDLDFDYSAEAE
jgi:hypothetical protein